MRIVNLTTEALNQSERGNMESYHAAAERIQDELNTPIELGFLAKVNYDTKTDRYVAVFEGQEKTAQIRVSEDVAEFLITNLRSGGGYWCGRMDKATLVDANHIRMK